MKTRRTLLLASIAAGGLLVAFASGAVPLSLSQFGINDEEGQSEGRASPSGYREGGDSDRHHERKAKKDDDNRYAERDHDDDDDDDDDDGGSGGQKGPARAGDATPPDNGLIRKGTTPKVQMN